MKNGRIRKYKQERKEGKEEKSKWEMTKNKEGKE